MSPGMGVPILDPPGLSGIRADAQPKNNPTPSLGPQLVLARLRSEPGDLSHPLKGRSLCSSRGWFTVET